MTVVSKGLQAPLRLPIPTAASVFTTTSATTIASFITAPHPLLTFSAAFPCPPPQRAQSEIHASVKQKRGKRALFYDLSLVLGWHAERAAGGGGGDSGASHEMDGIFRLYNVGQDTKYNPGGDKETSYMYELGFPRQHFGPSEPWAEAIKLAAADLFDLVAAVVERWVAELTAKATALAS